MRCSAGRTGGLADEGFELSRFLYLLEQGAGDGAEEEEEGGERSTGC